MIALAALAAPAGAATCPADLSGTGAGREPAGPQAGRPPEAEIEVSVPDPPPPLPQGCRIRVREVSSEEQPHLQEPSAAADEVEAAYRQAVADGTLESLVRFLDAFPGAPQSPEARSRANRLREQAAYRAALERNDPEGYREYLRDFPDSERRPEVEARLRVTQRAERRAEKGHGGWSKVPAR